LVFTRPRSSVVEHFLGKEEVIGSIPIVGSRFTWDKLFLFRILNVFRLRMEGLGLKQDWEL
jgi:hypothetical protein